MINNPTRTRQTAGVVKAPMSSLEAIKKHYEQSQSNQVAKILFYGDWGVGKTTLAMTAPGPILLQEFDPGGEKLKEVSDAEKSGRAVVDIRWQSREVGNAHKVYSEWSKDYRKMKAQGVFKDIASEGGTYILDSFTLLQRMMIAATAARSDKNPTAEGSGEFTTLTRKGYGVQHTAVDYMIGDILSLPCNVMIIAHAEASEDSKGITTGYQPLIVGAKLRAQLPILFEEIYVLHRLGRNRELYLAPKGMYNAKSHLLSLYSDLKEVYSVDKGEKSFSFEREIFSKFSAKSAD